MSCVQVLGPKTYAGKQMAAVGNHHRGKEVLADMSASATVGPRRGPQMGNETWCYLTCYITCYTTTYIAYAYIT